MIRSPPVTTGPEAVGAALEEATTSPLAGLALGPPADADVVEPEVLEPDHGRRERGCSPDRRSS
jgi:hypothetical protein